MPKRVVKGKKTNCFDKNWAAKHAASDKGSYSKQHEFEKGQDLEEARDWKRWFPQVIRSFYQRLCKAAMTTTR